MKETSIPVLLERDDLPSVPTLLHERARIAADHVAFAKPTPSGLTDVTTAEFLKEVRALARGLVLAGVRPGDTVAIMSPTRYEWSVASFAIWEAGGVVVPIYDTSSVSQARAILAQCDTHFAFVAGAKEHQVVQDTHPGCQIWSFDTGESASISTLRELGDTKPEIDAELAQRTSALTPEALASIVFTSGTTAGSKGVRITHANFVQLVLQVAAAYEEVVNEDASTIILLPLAHVLAQGLQLVSVYAGMKIVHESDPKAAVALMAQVKPTFMVVVPRVLEKIRAAARSAANEKRLGRIFAMAERAAVTHGEYLERTQDDALAKNRWIPAAQHNVFDLLFYRRLRALMGGKIDYLLSGASPLDAELANFFRGVGIPVVEGYGLTETTAPVTGNRPGRMRAGAVGIPIPGSSVRISDEGEVLVKGVGVSPGYLDPRQDAEAFEDGFFKTGDLGYLDEEGVLHIRGRLKNILVTANGKNIAPEPWEETVVTDPLISQVVMVGEGKPYAGALIVLDVEACTQWAKTKGLCDLPKTLEDAVSTAGVEGAKITDLALHEHIQRTVDRANKAVSRAEQVRRFTVLVTDLNEENGTLTPTQKLRRDQFLTNTAPHIETMYEEKV